MTDKESYVIKVKNGKGVFVEVASYVRKNAAESFINRLRNFAYEVEVEMRPMPGEPPEKEFQAFIESAWA